MMPEISMIEKLKALKNSSVTHCNKDDLVDLNSIVIDSSKSKSERMLDFLFQIKNPYLFKVGDVAVKVVYSNNEITLQKQMESLIKANLGK